MAKNAVCSWDFTIPRKSVKDEEEVKMKLKEICKMWCFQLEKGEKTEFMHYQGRVSFKLKTRKAPLLFPGIHWSPTSSLNKDNNFYVVKSETREAGPWSDKDKEVYVPKQYRDIKLYKWQQEIIDSRNVFNDRIIDMIYDEKGNNGKSTVASIAEIMYNAIDCPPINDCKELIQYVCNECMDNELRTPGLVFVDLPRAMNKDGLYGIYSAIEQIKKGKLVDTRYHGRKWWIDSPRIWVFSNHLPDLSLLSNDRWRIWTINKDTQQLERFLGGKPVTLAKKRIL